jgi:hypothetical protein
LRILAVLYGMEYQDAFWILAVTQNDGVDVTLILLCASFFQQITTNNNSNAHSTLEVDEHGVHPSYDETVRRILSNNNKAMASGNSDKNRQLTASGHREEGLTLEITRKTCSGNPFMVGEIHMKDGENNVVLVGKKPVSNANEFCFTLACGGDEMPDNYLKLVLLKGNDAIKFRLEVTYLHGKPGDLSYFLSGQSFDIGKSLSVHVGALRDNGVDYQAVATVATSTRYAMLDTSSSEDEESPPKSVRKTWNDAAMDVAQDDDDDDDDGSGNKFYDMDAHPEPNEIDADAEASSPDKGAQADYAAATPERTPTRRTRIVAAAIENSPQVLVEDTKPSPMKLVEDTKLAPMKVAKKNATARLVVIKGPYKGEEYFLGKGGSDKILFGSKPSTKAKNVNMISLPLDTNMKANHARLDFVGNKHCMKVNVTNMSAGGHTLVDVNPVSKDRVAFSGQTITIGDTVMRVESISN